MTAQFIEIKLKSQYRCQRITRLSHHHTTIPVARMLITNTCQSLLISSDTTYKHTPQFSLGLALNKDMDLTQWSLPDSNFSDDSKKYIFVFYSLVFPSLLPSVSSPAILTCSLLQCQLTKVCASSVCSPSATCKKKGFHYLINHKLFQLFLACSSFTCCVSKFLSCIHLPSCSVYVSWK